MKAKQNISKKGKRLESPEVEPPKQPPAQLPALFNEEKEDQLAGWQEEIVALAEAYLTIDTEQDVIDHVQSRVIRLCRLMQDLTIDSPVDEISAPALFEFMDVLEENIQIARWLHRGKPRHSNWE